MSHFSDKNAFTISNCVPGLYKKKLGKSLTLHLRVRMVNSDTLILSFCNVKYVITSFPRATYHPLEQNYFQQDSKEASGLIRNK